MNAAWMGIRPWEAECLAPWICFSWALTLEHSPGPIPGASLEARQGERGFWGSAHLASPAFLDLAGACGPQLGACGRLVSYQPQTRSRPGLPAPLWRIPPRLLDLWDDKLRTRHWLAAQGLPTLPCQALDQSWRGGGSGVQALQARSGSAGAATFIGEARDLARVFAAAGWESALLTPYVEGLVVNAHLAALPDGGVETSWPSLQLVAQVPEQGCVRPIYAGNDFKAYETRIPAPARKAIGQMLLDLGRSCVAEGYVGLLGADILYDPATGAATFLEMNPRMQGSTGLLMRIEASAGRIPLAARLFLALAGEPAAARPPRPGPVPWQEGMPAAQYILRQGVAAPQAPEEDILFRYGVLGSPSAERLAPVGRVVTSRTLHPAAPSI